MKDVDGTTSFAVAYVAQNGLGGHSIPTNKGVIQALEVVGVISATEAKKRRVPGLERAIPKTSGVEFASLLHQLGADFFASPFGSKIRSILVEISPDAKSRLPKRATKKKPTEQPEPAPASKNKGKKGTAKKSAKSTARPKKTSKKKSADAAPKSKKAAGTAKKKTKAASAGKKSPTKQLSRKKPR